MLYFFWYNQNMKKFIEENKFYLKSIILIFGINALIYFLIKLFISDYHLISIPLDNKIPFIKEFIYIYMIWYPFLIISYYNVWKYNKEKYGKLVLVTVTSLLILYMFFILYPTKVERPEVNSFHDLTTFVTYVTFLTDTPVNCFPSGHCLLCFVLMFSAFRDKKLPIQFRFIVSVLGTLIIFSTLFVKQHVILDAVGSLILAIFTYYIITNTKYFKKIEQKIDKMME